MQNCRGIKYGIAQNTVGKIVDFWDTLNFG